jgi:hypothetical protein
MVLGAAFPCWLAMALGDWLALLVLVPLWGLVAALICVPIRGWSALQWIGVLARHLVGQITGWSDFQSKAAAGNLYRDLDGRRNHNRSRSRSRSRRDDPFSGSPGAGHARAQRHGSNDGGGNDGGEDREWGEADLPGVLAGIAIHDGPPMAGRSTRPAIIQNHAAHTWAATARITHPGIGMADDGERARMGAGLAELFEAASASNQIHLVALQVRNVPDDGTERAEWVRHHARHDEPGLSARLHSQLEAMSAGAAIRHEVFLTVVVLEETIGKDAKRVGRGLLGRARILYGILAETESRLTGSIGCTRVTWLDTAELATAIRTGFEPGDAPALADAAIHHAADPAIPAGVPVAAAGPTRASTAIRSYRHGEWESVASTILLPRKGALMGALARALVPSQAGERRSLTVFYRPIATGAADRATSRSEMSAQMGAELRRKIGRTERAKDRRSFAQLHETDEKLERGRSLVAVYAAIAITVPAAWTDQDYGRRLDASVRLCGFTPLPLDGAHDAAFAAATIPLGVGVPNKRR